MGKRIVTERFRRAAALLLTAVMLLTLLAGCEKREISASDPKNNTVTFSAEHFSVYVVVESGEDARIKVVFHQADGTEVPIYVKQKDTNDSD